MTPDNYRPMTRHITVHRHPGDEINNLTHIEADDRDEGCGNASHTYLLTREDVFEEIPATADGPADTSDWDGPTIKDHAELARIEFQHGGRNTEGSTPGILDGALLAVVIDRYEGFQSGPFTCSENQEVLDHLYAALGVMKARIDKRNAQRVLGKNETHVS